MWLKSNGLYSWNSLYDLIWPLAYLNDLWPQNIMEANLAHLPTKLGYKQAYGWKVINPNKALQVNFHIWPLPYVHDLWPQNIVEANIGHLPFKFGYKHAYGWKVINRHNIVLQVNFHIWPQNIVDANIGHLPTKFSYKQAYGWKVINPNSLAGKLSHLTSFDLWPTYVTFDPHILWRPT